MMRNDNLKPENIDDFIAIYPLEVQEKLQKLRGGIGYKGNRGIRK